MFLLSSKTETVRLPPLQVLNLLIPKIAEKTSGDIKPEETIIHSYIEQLSQNNNIAKTSVYQIILMSFFLGYYYHIFRSTNEVVFKDEYTDPNS